MEPGTEVVGVGADGKPAQIRYALNADTRDIPVHRAVVLSADGLSVVLHPTGQLAPRWYPTHDHDGFEIASPGELVPIVVYGMGKVRYQSNPTPNPNPRRNEC